MRSTPGSTLGGQVTAREAKDKAADCAAASSGPRQAVRQHPGPTHTHHQGVTPWAHTNLKSQKQLEQNLGEAEDRTSHRPHHTRNSRVPT